MCAGCFVSINLSNPHIHPVRTGNYLPMLQTGSWVPRCPAQGRARIPTNLTQNTTNLPTGQMSGSVWILFPGTTPRLKLFVDRSNKSFPKWRTAFLCNLSGSFMTSRKLAGISVMSHGEHPHARGTLRDSPDKAPSSKVALTFSWGFPASFEMGMWMSLLICKSD